MKIEDERLMQLSMKPSDATLVEVAQLAIDLIVARKLGTAPKRNRVVPKPTTVTKTCVECGKEFDVSRGPSAKFRKFCSNECRWKATNTSINTGCREDVIRLWNEGKHATDIALELNVSRSRVGQILAVAGDRLVVQPKDRVKKSARTLIPCKGCGKPIARYGNQVYCTRDCFYENKPKKAKYPATTILTFKCDGCGINFERSAMLDNIHRHGGAKKHYCSTACYREHGPFGKDMKKKWHERVVEKIQKELRDAKPPEGIQG